MNYNQTKEEHAERMFIGSGQELASLNPKKFIEVCKNIPLLSAILDKALPCKEEVMRLNGNGVTKKKKKRNQGRTYDVPSAGDVL